MDRVLLAGALAVVLATRLLRLPDYPIYFFTDEAVQTLLAQDLVRDGFRDFAGRLFPTYFLNVYEFNLSTSVYVQLIPYLLFGKSVFLTRAVPALISVAAAGAVGWIAGRFLRLPHPWSAVLLLGVTPAWFLHTRTAFETSLMASFFAFFLLFYLYYRERGVRFLYPALLFGGLVFYSYAPGQIIALATAVFLLVIDARYHWSLRRQLAFPALFALIVAAPYIRFRIEQPGAHLDALRVLDSYWLRPIPLVEKLPTAAANYLSALKPAYWLWPDPGDLSRHQMGTYGHLARWAAPLMAIGLVLSLLRLRSPSYRAILAALLAVPFGAVVVGVGITRVLALTIPAALLAAAGLAWLAERLLVRLRAHGGVVLFTALVAVNSGFATDALRNGPTWSTNYGLYGMQFGARQVFGLAHDYLTDHPGDQLYISSSWSNGTDVLIRFFLPDDTPAQIASFGPWLEDPLELNDRMAFLVTADEFRQLEQERKLNRPEVLQIIPYPDGNPGFYLVHLSYSPEAAAIFAEEIAERRRPRVETLTVDGEPLRVQYPLLDMGEIAQIFDGDEYTLIRTYDANPALIVLEFSTPRQLAGLLLNTGSFVFDLTVRAYPPGSQTPETYAGSFHPPADAPTVRIPFERGPEMVTRLEIEFFQPGATGKVKVHLRELELLPTP